MKTRTSQIQNLLEQEYAQGMIDGLAQGLRAAEQIMVWHQMVWHQSNHTLKEPHSLEKIREWSDDALKQLKDNINECEQKLDKMFDK